LWSTEADQRRIEVQSLERPHSRLLIDDLLGTDARLDSLKHLILAALGELARVIGFEKILLICMSRTSSLPSSTLSYATWPMKAC
jgi:hypothetical protein